MSHSAVLCLKNSFLLYAIKAWNKLDHEIGNTETNASLRKMFLTFIVLFDKRKCWV